MVLGPPRWETCFYSSCSRVKRNAHVCSPPRSSASEHQWVGPPIGCPPPRSRSLRLPGDSVERPLWPAADLQYSSTWKLLFKDSAPSWGEPEKKALILEFSEETPRKEPALHTHAAGEFFILQTGTGKPRSSVTYGYCADSNGTHIIATGKGLPQATWVVNTSYY